MNAIREGNQGCQRGIDQVLIKAAICIFLIGLYLFRRWKRCSPSVQCALVVLVLVGIQLNFCRLRRGIRKGTFPFLLRASVVASALPGFGKEIFFLVTSGRQTKAAFKADNLCRYISTRDVLLGTALYTYIGYLQ